MSIARFFQTTAVGLSLIALSACGSTAADLAADALRAATVETQIDPDGATLEGDAVEFVQGTNPDVGMPFAPGETSTETALYEHRGWGVTRHATDTIPKVGAQAAAANNAAQTFIKLTGGKLLAGSTRITGVEGTPAIGYYPFYITWTTGLASGTTTVDGVQVRQAFAAPGVGPVYRVDNPTAVGVRFGRRPDGTTVLAAQLDADTGGAAFRPNHNSPYNYVLNNDLGNPSFGGGETADASPNPRFARGPNILDYNLVYRTTTGTSTIGWSGTPDSPADQDDHILRYYVDVVQPVQYANNGDWALQYSTFVLTRSQLRASGTDLVNRLGGAGSSNYFDAHIFSRLKTTNFVPILNTDADGNRASSGWAIYKARLAAWGVPPDAAFPADASTDRAAASKLYLLIGRTNDMRAHFNEKGVTGVTGTFETNLKEIAGRPGSASAPAEQDWRSVTFTSTGTNIGDFWGDITVGAEVNQDLLTGKAYGEDNVQKYDAAAGTGFSGHFAGPNAEEIVGLFGFTSGDAAAPDFLGGFVGERYGLPTE